MKELDIHPLIKNRLQYFINEAMYNFIQKQGKTKPRRKK